MRFAEEGRRRSRKEADFHSAACSGAKRFGSPASQEPILRLSAWSTSWQRNFRRCQAPYSSSLEAISWRLSQQKA
jgi:hypothetical protein